MFNRNQQQGKSEASNGATLHRLPPIDHLSPDERKRLKSMPLTIRWMPPSIQKVLLCLPETIVPVRTCARYPQVVEKLLSNWREPSAFRRTLASIMIDDRTSRAGFPFEVVNELGALGDYYDRFVFPQRTSAWANVDPY